MAGGIVMTPVRTRGRQEQLTSAEPAPETGLVALTHNDTSPVTPENDSELVANDLRTLLDQVAGTSVQEIDAAIADLQLLRQELWSDSERLQNEITAYASLSQSTRQSTKVIAESLANCKIQRMADPARLSAEERFRFETGIRPDGGAASRD
jgi:hypothetical protein